MSCVEFRKKSNREDISLKYINHPVSTSNRAAQESFNKGLTYIFAFNHDYAYREFEKAARFDPTLAMAYWGMALALGQNINQDVTRENEKRCYRFSQKALQLTSRASANEKAYINALFKRYTGDPSVDLIPLRFMYRDAMKKVVEEYPEDLDAASLYAESILDLDPWKYWTWDGKPKEGTLEAIEVLESVLKRNPSHIGANHYCIHAWEESPTPERALLSAYRLTTITSDLGHLLHMPCHIFLLVGDYEEAMKTSKRAIAADFRYIQEYGMGGNYPLHYLSHNMYVHTRVYMLSEDYQSAIKAAFELNQYVQPYFEADKHLLKYAVVPMEIYLYFHRWEELLAHRPPKGSFFVQSYWNFARGMAFANLGDLSSAQEEMMLLQKTQKEITESDDIANNPAKTILAIAELVLKATLAKVQRQNAQCIDYLHKAIDIQDRLNYDEPPAWFMPIRIQLGKILLEEKQYQEAENVFRNALSKLQRNGRLLFGLFLSLKGQNRLWDAFWVQKEMVPALKYATQPLTLEDL